MNNVFDWYHDIKYFGVGRKHHFPGAYSKEEIEADNKQFKELMENDVTRGVVETSDYPVSLAEYAAGYYLSFCEKDKEERPLHKQMYQDYLSGKADEALLRLIRIKEMR